MTCPVCDRWAPGDAETGYDVDDVCPTCAREGWELTTDGQLLGPDDVSEEPVRPATIAEVPRRMVRARLRRVNVRTTDERPQDLSDPPARVRRRCGAE